MKNIVGENYNVTFNEAESLFCMEGTFRLRGMDEYVEIGELLESALDANSVFTVDVTKLMFLNSSGIAMLSKFIIKARENEGLELIVKGSNDVPWQGKSLQNLKRLMPSLNLIFV